MKVENFEVVEISEDLGHRRRVVWASKAAPRRAEPRIMRECDVCVMCDDVATVWDDLTRDAASSRHHVSASRLRWMSGARVKASESH